MFIKLEDTHGDVCVNLDTGLRFRPMTKHGLASGVKIIFPDGSTFIEVRGDYGRMCDTVRAVDAQ